MKYKIVAGSTLAASLVVGLNLSPAIAVYFGNGVANADLPATPGIRRMAL